MATFRPMRVADRARPRALGSLDPRSAREAFLDSVTTEEQLRVLRQAEKVGPMPDDSDWLVAGELAPVLFTQAPHRGRVAEGAVPPAGARAAFAASAPAEADERKRCRRRGASSSSSGPMRTNRA